MDQTQIAVSSLAGVVILVVMAFALGIRIGANIAGKHLVNTIIEQGFVNVAGVRYRVDQIGRKAK